MSFEDPRGSLPPSSIQLHSTAPKMQSSRRSFPQLPKTKIKHTRTRKPPCYDWIFSSGTNIHIAVDKFWFKTFTPFDTYTLTVAGQQTVSVRGIGSVELKIRCKPNSHQSRVINLENVLYVPGWICNVLSDNYFNTDLEIDSQFEHRWTEHGVCFTKKTAGKVKPWGYTESFCGLDRLVLSRKPHGRSPMLEDPDREVWAVNLNWPSSQQDKWNAFKAKELQRLAKEHEAEIVAQQQRLDKHAHTESTELLIPKNTNPDIPNPKLKTGSIASPSKVSVRSKSENNLAKVMARQVSAASFDLQQSSARMSLNELSNNRIVMIRNDAEGRVSSLKATFNANRGMLKDFLAAQSKENKS